MNRSSMRLARVWASLYVAVIYTSGNDEDLVKELRRQSLTGLRVWGLHPLL